MYWTMANLLPTVYQRKLLITDALLKPTWEGSENMLEVKNLNVFYGPIHALKGISLKVKKGGIVALIGSNGAGKSTTLSAITGLVKTSRVQLL